VNVTKRQKVAGFNQTQQYIFILILSTCFCRLTSIRPPLRNSESGARSADSIHVIWDPITLEKYIKIY